MCSPYKNLTFARNFVNLAPKLTKHVIAIESYSTRLTVARNLVNLAPKLTQHVTAIGSLSTRLPIARNFVHLAPKLMQHVICSVCLQCVRQNSGRVPRRAS